MISGSMLIKENGGKEEIIESGLGKEERANAKSEEKSIPACMRMGANDVREEKIKQIKENERCYEKVKTCSEYWRLIFPN